MVVPTRFPKSWNQAKNTIAPWGEDSKEAYSSGLANLAAALKNWHASRTGKRGGPAVGFPKFKRRKGDAVGSVRFTTGTIRLDGRAHACVARDRAGQNA